VFKKSQQVAIEIDSKNSWLGVSPDGIVFDPTQQEYQKGCLEVKCSYVCEKRTNVMLADNFQHFVWLSMKV